MAATLEHSLDKLPIAVQRVAGNDATFERQHAQNFQRSFGLVAAGRLPRGQGHSGLDREDIDHMQRRGASAAFVGATQRLAIDGNDAGKLDLVGLGEGGREPPKSLLERFRIQCSQHPAEGVVARDAVLQSQKLPQRLLLGPGKQSHVRGAVPPTQCRSKRDDDDIEQIVIGVGRPRIRQVSEDLSEFLHWTPSAIRESSSESMLRAGATSMSNPHAIPLPARGRGTDRPNGAGMPLPRRVNSRA